MTHTVKEQIPNAKEEKMKLMCNDIQFNVEKTLIMKKDSIINRIHLPGLSGYHKNCKFTKQIYKFMYYITLLESLIFNLKFESVECFCSDQKYKTQKTSGK